MKLTKQGVRDLGKSPTRRTIPEIPPDMKFPDLCRRHSWSESDVLGNRTCEKCDTQIDWDSNIID